MKILVIGGGGREHAIVWALSRSRHRPELFIAPGNAGTQSLAKRVDIAVDQVEALADWAVKQAIDLTIVGPELPLTLGIVDTFRKRGRVILGPSQIASQLESSKLFAKSFMDRHAIPTAAWKSFEDAAACMAHVQERPLPMVIKADGLAAGKGVVVAETRDEALKAVKDLSHLGTLIVEDCLKGTEVSVIAICDGESARLLAPAADHKRAFDGNRGPNTGGMGAYCPVPWVDADLIETVRTQILDATLSGMAADGMPFVGFLYMGLMVVAGKPQVLEYNVRLGDPEAQAILPRLKSDFVELCARATAGSLYQQSELQWDLRNSVCVVMAAEGYPDKPVTGFPIAGLPTAMDDAVVFHAGTTERDGQVIVSGGRVLGVSALGKTFDEARDRAYSIVDGIQWPGAWCRTDIAKGVV